MCQMQNVTTVLFSSQGAERKMRDEERKRSKRRGKNDAGEFTSVMNSSKCSLWREQFNAVDHPVYVPSKVHSEQLYQQRVHLLPNSGWPCNPSGPLHPRDAHLQPAAHGGSRFTQFFSPQLLSQPWFQPLHPRRHETGTEGGKPVGTCLVGKVGWEGEDMVSAHLSNKDQVS